MRTVASQETVSTSVTSQLVELVELVDLGVWAKFGRVWRVCITSASPPRVSAEFARVSVTLGKFGRLDGDVESNPGPIDIKSDSGTYSPSH